MMNSRKSKAQRTTSAVSQQSSALAVTPLAGSGSDLDGMPFSRNFRNQASPGNFSAQAHIASAAIPHSFNLIPEGDPHSLSQSPASPGSFTAQSFDANTAAPSRDALYPHTPTQLPSPAIQAVTQRPRSGSEFPTYQSPSYSLSSFPDPRLPQANSSIPRPSQEPPRRQAPRRRPQHSQINPHAGPSTSAIHDSSNHLHQLGDDRGSGHALRWSATSNADTQRAEFSYPDIDPMSPYLNVFPQLGPPTFRRQMSSYVLESQPLSSETGAAHSVPQLYQPLGNNVPSPFEGALSPAALPPPTPFAMEDSDIDEEAPAPTSNPVVKRTRRKVGEKAPPKKAERTDKLRKNELKSRQRVAATAANLLEEVKIRQPERVNWSRQKVQDAAAEHLRNDRITIEDQARQLEAAAAREHWYKVAMDEQTRGLARAALQEQAYKATLEDLKRKLEFALLHGQMAIPALTLANPESWRIHEAASGSTRTIIHMPEQLPDQEDKRPSYVDIHTGEANILAVRLLEKPNREVQDDEPLQPQPAVT